MARIRSIKPELPSDLTLASVSMPARYTFVLLITQADDYGLVPAAPRQMLGLLYPHDHDIAWVDLQGWLAELVKAGLVAWRVTEDGVGVVELVKWGKHQRIDNAGRSTLRDTLTDGPGKPPRVSANRRKIPLGEGEGKGVGKGQGKGSYVRSPNGDADEWLKDFEAAWGLYPRRPNNPKTKARKAYLARRKAGVSAEALLEGTRRYAAYVEREHIAGQFVKLAATFFGPDEHWLTDYGAPEDHEIAVYDERGEMTPEFARAMGRSA